MKNAKTFTPSASVVINAPAPHGRTFAADLPPLDPENTALLILNQGAGAIDFVLFQQYRTVTKHVMGEAMPGRLAVPVRSVEIKEHPQAGPGVHGSRRLRGGQSLLIEDEGAAAAYIAISTHQPGPETVMIQRGRVAVATVF